jgi:hypothetical protein
MEILLPGRPVSASEAKRLGLVNPVGPDALVCAQELCCELMSGSATARAEIKQLVRATPTCCCPTPSTPRAGPWHRVVGAAHDPIASES